jgi:hypothetical protein
MVHNWSPSLHTILEESTNEGDTAFSGGGSFDFPISQGCNIVTPSAPIKTTLPSEGTPATLTIPTVPLWTVVPQPNTGLCPKQQQAYQEEQQVQAHVWQATTKHMDTLH